jgi:hypothetical protein
MWMNDAQYIFFLVMLTDQLRNNMHGVCMCMHFAFNVVAQISGVHCVFAKKLASKHQNTQLVACSFLVG